MIEDKEMAQIFKVESAEHLARLDAGLLNLEKTPADQSLLDEVFRESHSLKGAARMLGLSRVEAAAHGMENTLNMARKNEAPLTPEAIERMTAMLGELRRLVAIECGMRIADCGLQNAELKTDTKPDTSFDISQSDIPHSAVSTPQSNIPQSAISTPQSEFPIPHSDIPQPTISTPQSAIPIPQFAEVPPSIPQSELHIPHSEEPFRIETVRVETRKLDDLLTLVGELSVIEGRAQHRLTLLDALLDQWAAMERSRKKRNAEFGVRNAELEIPHSAISIPQSNDSAIHNPQSAFEWFGNRLRQARDAFYEDGARLSTTVDALEEMVHAARLLPLSTLFALFPRMVHDLAKQQGKEVELIIEGGEIGVDKRILEEMKDPLMHMLRNAIDHGIEAPHERQGKKRMGTLSLLALREGNNVLLKVRDDGRGLDMEAIKRVALKRGLISNAEYPIADFGIRNADSNPQSNAAQLQQLIFLPGFSTSSFVTELSGRGVGLDVVRVNVERLKGDIRIQSTPHHGTELQVRLPLCLSTTRLLLASVNGRLFGLPIEFVHTSLQLREKDIFTLDGYPATKLDGQSLIAPRLADLLELPDSPPLSNSPPQARERAVSPSPSGRGVGRGQVCVVIQVGDERLGLRVDDLMDEEEVVAKPLSAPLARVRNVTALSMLGSGEICAVLNPADLLRTAHKGMRSADFGMRSGNLIPQSEIRTPHSKAPHSILLVEDSALVRAMEKRILEDAGYEVAATVDGMDALGALGRSTFAAVVSDIMMPNMDGLTLTARIRQEPRYKDMPVILVSSLASDEDKRRGLEVGANAYIPKPSFDQRLLLETLKRLI